MTKEEIEELKQLTALQSKFPNGAIIGTYNAPGSIHIGPVNNLSLDSLFSKDKGEDVGKAIIDKISESNQQTITDVTLTNEDVNDRRKLILSIATTFNCTEVIAEQYLDDIETMSDDEVTDLTRRYVDEKKIQSDFNHHKLWEILSGQGFYKSKIRNWNHQLQKE